MNRIDEKRLLAVMLRNSGKPDLALEEELRQLGFLQYSEPEPKQAPSIPLLEVPQPILPIVDQVAKTITTKSKTTDQVPLTEKMMASELSGLRKQINDITQRMGTLAFGGGGTGVVRIQDTDDFNKFSIVQGGTLTYENGTFYVREAGNIDSLNGTVTGTFSGNVVISSVEDHGIKVDVDAPTYGWRDIIGSVQPKATGVGSPTRTLYRGNIFDYAFVLNDQVDFVFHIPHDYVPGTDIFFHVHWSHNGTSVSGLTEFTIYHMYAKGHDQENFSDERILTIQHNNVDINTTPRYRHFIDEQAISGPLANTNVFATSEIEVDGLLICTLKLTSRPTIGSGSLFIHTCDIHYQSTNMATKNKAPSFYTVP